MYFEIYKKGNLIIRGRKILNTISIDNELMVAPSTTLVLPIDYLSVIDGREEIKLFLDDCRVFWAIVWDIEVNKEDETIDLDLRHVVTEWQYRQISVNHAQQNKALNIVYMGDKTTRNEGNDEVITASDFEVGLNEGKKLTKAQIISKARATAWQISNGDKVEITSVKIEKCETNDDKETCTETNITEATTYKITFKTAKGTSVSIELNVQEKYEPDYSTLDGPAIADKLEDIYNDKNFAYPGWEIDFKDSSGSQVIEYVYSRQNKLEALTRTMELTQDLWWRVGLWNEKRIEIGKFGEIKPYIISTKPSGATNIRMINEPVIDYDFENVVNVATVLSDKSDGGMSSLTLREIYERPELQRAGFPVVILHANVNNERDYTRYISQYPKLAPNNEIEYAVIDEESVALEGGTVIEGTYSFNDISAFQDDGKVIPDSQRIEVARTVYDATVKKLIQARRTYDMKVTAEPLPCDVEVGDRIRCLYDNKLWDQVECSSYWKKILTLDDLFYITRIEYEFDDIGNMVNILTLSKWLKIDRETMDLLG